MARQLALWAAVLLFVGVVAAALAPTARQPAAPVFPAPRPTGAPAGRTVDAALPAAAPVVADEGDVVRLHVLTNRPDRVVVEGLGARAPVGPGSDGIVELVADAPGRWQVRLEDDGMLLGVLEVEG